MDGIVSVFPSRTHKLLTTRSWDFLGLPQTPPEELPLEGDVIIGMLDGGIWPDSPSFSDDGFGPLPSRWKDVCQNFTCNNKIIGARAYNQGSSTGLSPLNEDGHGSHTASTAAGRAVGDVSFGGLAAGTARSAVPGARLAVYKVCWEDDCADADVLAAFDDAIADGVDVISYSVGTLFPLRYFRDAAAIGSFHAMRRGVVTSASPGNSGLRRGFHVSNVAPWMLSVAASSMDRRFVDRIVLGNGDTIVGTYIYTFPTLKNAPLVFPTGGSCDPGDLAGVSYEGKILLCRLPKNKTDPNDGSGPLSAGAAGAVVLEEAPDAHFTMPLPGLAVTRDQFDEIMAYVNSTSNPVGTIESTEATVDPQAPVAASFSSPGPNLITPGILKPDLSAPGIDIIAAWSPVSYVKSFHRGWSPAMIMSALITTATPMNTPANSGWTALKYGAGQLSPEKARDPGLVYDASEGDYVAMLCEQGYNATQLALVTGSNATACDADGSRSPASSSGGDLNYPTMAARVEPGKNFTVRFPRTVTNVGAAASAAYDAKVLVSAEAAKDLAVDVSPSKLEFTTQNQKASFTGRVHSAAVVWYNDEHQVRSPVVVYTADSHKFGF
ncbi:hypothetical protein PVAP13_2KG347000 [Panicum virgatum]|uniref:Uncharacterized protein n=1 Tax=Panicum virgatum TaxID=38727 RepID=A0A8T0W7E7_PANVG|nr:hypothetical protein PVAP13_2KG347000 [Panicum virgatum]